jgi:hypothetical protein
MGLMENDSGEEMRGHMMIMCQAARSPALELLSWPAARLRLRRLQLLLAEGEPLAASDTSTFLTTKISYIVSMTDH